MLGWSKHDALPPFDRWHYSGECLSHVQPRYVACRANRIARIGLLGENCRGTHTSQTSIFPLPDPSFASRYKAFFAAFQGIPMCPHSNGGSRRALCSAALLATVLAVEPLCAEKIDLNGNGMSDIWELIYGASGLARTATRMGTACPTAWRALRELIPSTRTPSRDLRHNPIGHELYRQHGLRVGQAVSVAERAGSGQQHCRHLDKRNDPGGPDGTVVNLTAPASVAQKFFRISISDVDTDGDGVNDWEKYKLGLDPSKAFSNNQLDANGQPMNDYAYVVSRLASQNVVTITATGPTAYQPDPGQNAVNPGHVHGHAGRLPAKHGNGQSGTGRSGRRVCHRRRGPFRRCRGR